MLPKMQRHGEVIFWLDQLKILEENPQMQRPGKEIFWLDEPRIHKDKPTIFRPQVFPAEKMVSLNNWYHKVISSSIQCMGKMSFIHFLTSKMPFQLILQQTPLFEIVKLVLLFQMSTSHWRAESK